MKNDLIVIERKSKSVCWMIVHTLAAFLFDNLNVRMVVRFLVDH